MLFTEPEVPRAGEKVTVYYSPASTALAGREQIYITAGFNRWGHLRRLGPAAMKPPGEGGLHHRVGGPQDHREEGTGRECATCSGLARAGDSAGQQPRYSSAPS